MHDQLSRFALALLLWVAATASCSCASLPPVPDQGGPAWLRLESEHFVLFTDVDEANARDAILKLERLLDAYGQLGWQTHGKLPVKLDVVMFDDVSEFEVFSGDTGGFHVRLMPFEPLVVMPYAGRVDSWIVLKHELTHYIAGQALPFQPPWFAEGIASYFQSAYFDAEQRFVVGSVPRQLRNILVHLGREPARELLAAESADQRPRFYASSWLLVHYLMSERGEAFVKLQDGYAEGMTHDSAWRAAFPDLPPDRLDETLERYAENGQFANYLRPVPAYAGAAPSVAPLSSADVYALRARLYLSCPNCDSNRVQAVAENVDQALRRDPQQLVASLVSIAMLPRDQRLPRAKALTSAHPEAWQAWAMQAGAEQLAPETGRQCSEEARNHLHALGERSAYSLMLWAACRAAAGAKQEALAGSAQALARQPADTALLQIQAGVLLLLRECDALRRLMPRLRSAVHPKIDADTLSNFEACKPVHDDE